MAKNRKVIEKQHARNRAKSVLKRKWKKDQKVARGRVKKAAKAAAAAKK